MRSSLLPPGKSWRRYPALLIVGVVCVYLILLWPDPSPTPAIAEHTQPFRWDRDAYWSALEERFVGAQKLEAAELNDRIQTGLLSATKLLDSCQTNTIDPESPLMTALEQAMFDLGPLIAAETSYLPAFVSLQSRLRRTIKDQSRYWDMSTVETRDRLYRLLYGSRTAVEEVMLQADDNQPALARSIDEPSMAPPAAMLGVTLHSGDILVSRGGAATSALIARGNDYPGNFSHVAFVHVDETSHEISIIESHIEVGVLVTTVDQYLQDTKLRILVLRLRADHPALVIDPLLPHTAATLALERATHAHTAYDFKMDFEDNAQLFCSEVASDPYAQLDVHLWMGISNISSPGVRSWLAAFGVEYFTTQEPSDLEYDPQLRVVAEWRDPETLWKDHLDNAVIDAMLESANAGERLEYDWYLLPLGRVAKAYSVIKNLFGGVGPVPEGMSATSALTNEWFSRRHAAIKAELMERVEEFRLAHDYRPPYWELVKQSEQAAAETAR